MVLLKKSNLHPVWLAAISGVLLWVSWPTSPLTLLIFSAWVPLFMLEARSKRLLPFWGWTYLTLLIWNVATTWWVGNTPVPISGVLANVLNALIMTVPWIGFWKAKRRFGLLPGYAALVAYWLTFEYIHLNWELSWPWLTLGNAFAGVPGWVQWYEWTGTSGGTLWVLLVNMLVYEAIKSQEPPVKRFKGLALALGAPAILSGLLYAYRHHMSSVPDQGPNVVVVQPNIDPYNEKFEAGTEAAQLAQLIALSESAVDSNTDVVIWPETALPFEVNEPQFWQVPSLKPLHAFLARYPRIKLLTGLAGFRYLPRDTTTMAMRYDSATGRNYEEYNSALQTDSSRAITFYHKGKLVPGAEIMPYRWLFGFLDKYSLDLGGTSGTYGRGMERVVFPPTQSGYRIGPIICYESIYSAYVTGYVRNGANLLAIITNDGWWGNTQGYKQHQQYARLRAIETRRWVARSANTGISCFIDPLGKVYQPQPWNTKAVIKMNLPPETTKTLYVQLGDWISILALIWTLLAQGAGILSRIRKRTS
jgi:apolipoprotein N-acyltransferase